MNKNLAAFVALTLALAILGGCNASPPSISVEKIWSRPAIIDAAVEKGEKHEGMHHGSGTNGVVYFTIRNTGGSSDRLLSINTEVCDSPELHTTTMTGETMSMQKLSNGLEIPAGGQVEFKPRSHHVMLIGLRQDLLPGTTFSLRLNFEKSGAIDVSSQVTTP